MKGASRGARARRSTTLTGYRFPRARGSTLALFFSLQTFVSSLPKTQRVPLPAFTLAASARGTPEGRANSPMVKSELETLRARVRDLERQLATRGLASESVDLAGARGRGTTLVGTPPLDYPAFATPKKGTARRISEDWWDPRVVAPSLGSRPIGYIKTSFPTKNGCPRQGTICEHARAKLTVEFGTNPQYSLDGLADFSHVWLLFLFSDNGASHSPRAKVLPPRLRGKAKGVFATRAPHRPNPIGLTLARLDSVDGATLELSALDLVDGTPVLDVKPFISAYDTPACGDVRCPTWCLPREETLLGVRVSDAARLDLADIKASAERPRLARSWSEALTGLCEVLVQDPRSTYRRDKCGDERYPIYFDRLKAWCAFGTEGEQETVEVLSLSVERPPRK